MNRRRRARVYFKNRFAGIIEETESGHRFTYDLEFLEEGRAIAVAFPPRKEPFESGGLFAFFQGLLPEGWFRAVVCQTLKIDPTDDFGLLIYGCKDCIGAVSVIAEEKQGT